MSLKNFNDTIENRTCDLPTCNTVSQPTAPSRTPFCRKLRSEMLTTVCTGKGEVEFGDNLKTRQRPEPFSVL